MSHPNRCLEDKPPPFFLRPTHSPLAVCLPNHCTLSLNFQITLEKREELFAMKYPSGFISFFLFTFCCGFSYHLMNSFDTMLAIAIETTPSHLVLRLQHKYPQFTLITMSRPENGLGTLDAC